MKYGNKQAMEKEMSNFTPVKSGSYIVKIVKMEVKEKRNYNGEVVPMLCLEFSPYESNARKPEMKNLDGETVKPLTRKLWYDIEKISMGFRDNMTLPSKFRALAAALQDMDPNDEVEGPDELNPLSALDFLKEYDGGYVVAQVAAYEKEGKSKNKITDFLPLPEDFQADPIVEATLADAEKKRAEKKSGEAIQGSDEEVTLEESAPTAKAAKVETKKPLF